MITTNYTTPEGLIQEIIDYYNQDYTEAVRRCTLIPPRELLHEVLEELDNDYQFRLTAIEPTHFEPAGKTTSLRLPSYTV